MGLCVSTETDDYEHVKYFDGQRCLGFRHGEGTYYYENGDIYVGEWRWNMKHGRGVYSPKNEEVRKGFFYHDEYIGTEHGGLFAATRCSCFKVCAEAQPLVSDEEERKKQMERIRKVEGERMRQKQEEKMRQRKEREQKRDELRQKYNLPKSKHLTVQ